MSEDSPEANTKAPRLRARLWVAGASCLAVAMLAWALWPAGTKTVYTDNVSARVDAEDVTLRDVIWEHPTPVFPGNRDEDERYDPNVSADNLTLVFVKGRPGEGADLFVAKREGEGWSEARSLEDLNTEYDELGPSFSRDGKWLFFYSNRRGGLGGYDIWVSRLGDSGWEEPVNLGPAINTAHHEIDPTVHDAPVGRIAKENEAQGEPGWQVKDLYFASSRPLGDSVPPRWRGTAREQAVPRGDFNLFHATNDAAEGLQFTDVSPLSALNTKGDDAQPTITRRGNYLYFSSNGRGGAGGFDLFRSRIERRAFKAVELLDRSVNTPANETDPTLFRDGHRLVFSSDRAPHGPRYQLYETITREVFPMAEAPAKEQPAVGGGFLDLFEKYKWWFALLLLSLLALLALLKSMADESRRAQLSLMQRCLLGSLGLHMLLAFLLSLWLISEAIYKHVKEQVVEITLTNDDEARQEEEEALNKPVQANLAQASAQLPTPREPNTPSDPDAQPVEPTPPNVDTTQVKPDEMAIKPPEVTLPDTEPETLPTPQLPTDSNQPATPQLPRELLETAQVTPAAANPKAAPVPNDLKVNPSPQQQAAANPASTSTQPPTPATQNPATAKPLEQTANTRVNTERLTPVETEQPLPKLEVSVNKEQLEQSQKTTADPSQKMANASDNQQVKAQPSETPRTQPTSANTQTPASQPVKAAQSLPKEQSLESMASLPTLETSQPASQPDTSPAAQASAVKQETNTTSAASTRKLANASSAQSLSQQPRQAATARPEPREALNTVNAQAQNTTTATKESAIESASKPANVVKPNAPTAGPKAEAAQVSSVKQSTTSNTAEAAQTLAQATTTQPLVQQPSPSSTTNATPAEAKSQPAEATPAATQSVAAKETSTQTEATEAALHKNSQASPEAATVDTNSVAMEQNQAAAEQGSQLSHAASQQTVAPQSTPNAQSAPTPASVKAAQSTPINAQTTAQTQQSTQTPTAPEAIESAQSQTQLPQGSQFTLDHESLETAKAGVESSTQLSQASSSVTLKAAAAPAAESAPTTATSAPVQASQAPKATAVSKSQTVDAQSQTAKLSSAQAVNNLPQTSMAKANKVTLEQTSQSSETGQKLAQASTRAAFAQAQVAAANAQTSPQSADQSIAPARSTAQSTAVSKVSAATAKSADANLQASSTKTDSNSPAATLNAQLETSEAASTDATSLAKATSQLAVHQAAAQTPVASGAEPLAKAAEALTAANSNDQTAAVKPNTSASQANAKKLVKAESSSSVENAVVDTLAGLQLESPETDAESGAAGAKVASQQTVRPIMSGITESNPQTQTAVRPQPATIRPSSLMATNVASIQLPTSSRALSQANLSSTLLNSPANEPFNLHLQTTPGGAEASQSMAKAVDNSQPSEAPPTQPTLNANPTDRASRPVDIPLSEMQTTAQRQAITDAKVAPDILSAAPALPTQVESALPSSLEIKAETTLPTTTPSTSFAGASRGQAIKPAIQAASASPRRTSRPMPFLAAAQFQFTPLLTAQQTATTPIAPGQLLDRVDLNHAEADASSLPGVQMKFPDNGRIELAQGGRFENVTSQGASLTANSAGPQSNGSPLPTRVEGDKPPTRMESLNLVQQDDAARVEYASNPLKDIRDNRNMILPDSGIPDAPILEAPGEIKNPLVLRHDPKMRLEIIDQLGGSEETERAIMRALDWFTRNQEADGHWDGPAGHDHAATGMAMLAYMGWGAKHTEAGPYQKPLAKAVDWMIRHTGPDGDLRGFRGRNFMYDHGIAAIAVAEAYSLTKDPRLRPIVERIVDFTVRAQNPKTGGWRYQPFGEQGYSDRGDMSVTGWQIMALKSAKMGGIKVPAESLDKAIRFMQSVSSQRVETLRLNGGRQRIEQHTYGYYTKGDPNLAMVAEGMFCQQLLRKHSLDRRIFTSRQLDKIINNSAQHILYKDDFIKPGKRRNARPEFNYYYWYYSSLALHQLQGPVWERWNQKMRPVFLKAQIHNPDRIDLHGSWDPMGQWGGESGRCIVTAMATLSLEVYYRYLPMYTPAWAQDAK